MASLDGQSALSAVYRMVEAGERGFATAAENMPTQSLKILMKFYAQRHANFKAEILTELARLGQAEKPWSSIPGMIHRGRISIFAALAEKNEREKIILGEVALGENVAAKVYRKALSQPLPAQTRAILERQAEEIRKIREQVSLVQARVGRHLIVQLCPNEQAARRAAQNLEDSGTEVELIQIVDIREADLYPLQGATVFETMLSGAFGGALWGGIGGVLAGFGVTQTITPAPSGIDAILQSWLPAALTCMLVGVLISTVLGFFIGISISEEDGFQLNHILDDHLVLLSAVVNQA